MKLSSQIAKQFREVHFGDNWTDVNLKDSLEGITWQMATAKVYSFNTIAILVFHMNYYTNAVMSVLQEKPLSSKHKLSFDCPPIGSDEDWQKLKEKTWADAEIFAGLVEKLPENKLGETFFDKKYGNYYRNIHGVIEHVHYHLGQIVLIKKILLHPEKI